MAYSSKLAHWEDQMDDAWRKAKESEKLHWDLVQQKKEFQDQWIKDLMDDNAWLRRELRKEREERQRLRKLVKPSESVPGEVDAKRNNKTAGRVPTPAIKNDKTVEVAVKPIEKKTQRKEDAAPSSDAAKQTDRAAAVPTKNGQAPAAKKQPSVPQQKERRESTTVDVPAEHIGRVIGRGRRNLDRLEKEFKVKIKIPPPAVDDNWRKKSSPAKVTVFIYGDDLEGCRAAGRDILDNLPDALLVPLDAEMIPIIVGRGGETLQSLRSRYDHVRIEMPSDAHPGELKIQGPAKTCRAVLDDVLALIKKHRDE